MNCIRCGKDLGHADDTNADYIMADDTIVVEPVLTLVALKQNKATRAKRKLEPRPEILDSEYDRQEVAGIHEFNSLDSKVKLIEEFIDKPVQKTGIICPGCYKETDFVIWGIHKEKQSEVV